MAIAALIKISHSFSEYVSQQTALNPKISGLLIEFMQLLYPFAPVTALEMAEILGETEATLYRWPERRVSSSSTKLYRVSLNGKYQRLVTVSPSLTEAELIETTKSILKLKATPARIILDHEKGILSLVM